MIFEAHASEEKDGALDFSQLREHRTQRYQQARAREAETIDAISERIALEIEKQALVGNLKSQVASKETLVKGYSNDLTKFIIKGTEAQAVRHEQLSTSIQTLNGRIAAFSAQRRAFVALQDEVQSTRSSRASRPCSPSTSSGSWAESAS